MSLRLRLLLTLVPLFIFSLVAANVGTYASLRGFLLSRVDDQLLVIHDTVLQALTHPDETGTTAGPRQPFPFWMYAEILTPAGQAVGQPISIPGPGQATAQPLLPASLVPGQVLTVPGTGAVSQYRVYVDRTVDSSGDIHIVALALNDMNDTLHQLLVLELLISGGVTVIVAVVSWVIIRRGLRPLEHMGATARSIVLSDLSKRVEPSTERTEVGRLGLALNTMLSQLQAAFAERQRNEQRLRHFISDASHELRTPLTSMRGYTELLQRNPQMDPEDLSLSLSRMEAETGRMAVLVDDLLLLARLDQGRPLERERVDLEALIVDACADARVADPQRAIVARIAAPLVVIGDDARLRQVIGNVLRNAVVHTPPGTPIDVVLHPEADRAVVEVVDHGAGIPAGHADRIFERFHRADPERSGDQGGSGLGLSIAAAVVAAHGGSIDVTETPGGGATFRIRLPLAA